MAKDFNKRNLNLKTRRLGPDAFDIFNNVISEYAGKQEKYETRSSKPAIRYVLGAMSSVDPAYTQIGIDEARRVAKQLADGLQRQGVAVEFRLQGSLPLDVHIKGVSDVDLLALHGAILTSDPGGMGAYSTVGKAMTDVMKELRMGSESVLKSAFPGAVVDTSGVKSINLSGGSLRRKVDVVPSHWHDTIAYQASQQEYDRIVFVWDKATSIRIPNKPFWYMKAINEKDYLTNGGLKKAIRLLKNISKDAQEDGVSIGLSSYDIGSIMWYADTLKLSFSDVLELSILVSIEQYLEELLLNPTRSLSLYTPDGSRLIFDTPEKFEGLKKLYHEVVEISADVAQELDVFGSVGLQKDRVRGMLQAATIAR